MWFRGVHLRGPGRQDRETTLIIAATESKEFPFATLEKTAGICKFMAAAFPGASLNTFHIYKEIGYLQRTDKSPVSATRNTQNTVSAHRVFRGNTRAVETCEALEDQPRTPCPHMSCSVSRFHIIVMGRQQRFFPRN